MITMIIDRGAQMLQQCKPNKIDCSIALKILEIALKTLKVTLKNNNVRYKYF